MDILILDGIDFLGRHITQAAISAGHQVTLFNRNKINPHLFPEANRIIGDRFKAGDIDALKNTRWDAVIDLNGYQPKYINQLADILKDNIQHYLYLSSASVYDLTVEQNQINETSPLVSSNKVLSDDNQTFVYASACALSVLCEQAVQKHYDKRYTILRPGLITGPYDNTDRISYWLNRVAQADKVLVPQNPDDAFQMIDARDLANFVIKSIEENITGTFNIAAPQHNWNHLMECCRRVCLSNANYHWVNDSSFLNQTEVKSNRPLGAYPLLGLHLLFKLNSDKAVAVGLECRSTIETLNDIAAWQNTRKMLEGECPIEELSELVAFNACEENANYWMCGVSVEDEAVLVEEWQRHLLDA